LYTRLAGDCRRAVPAGLRFGVTWRADNGAVERSDERV